MPANPNAPFGFRYEGRRDGSPPNFGSRLGRILNANTNKIFTGDVLKPLASGYYDVATEVAGGAAVGGVAGWFRWVSVSNNKTVWQNWWPGNSDSAGANPVEVDLYSDPFSLFQVQCLLGPITQASVGLNANFNVGAGGQQTGAGNLSSFSLDDGTLGADASLPFKVYQLPNYDPTNPLLSMAGYDPSVAYNQVLVTFNNLVA